MKFIFISLLNFIMRVPYNPPLSHHFDVVFTPQFSRNERGGGLSDIRIYQKRGGSLFGILGGMFKKAIPFLKNILLPEVGNFVKNITQDISQNIPSRESFRNNFSSSAKNIGSRIMRGGKRKTKTKQKQKNIKKKIHKNKKKTKRKKLVI